MNNVIAVNNQSIILSEPTPVPSISKFVGRKRELQLCRAAWGVTDDGSRFFEDVTPLHFRLEGSPGCGKNEIVYEIARHLNQPLYTIQGHEEVTPEDLSLLLVPDPGTGDGRSVPLTLRASPLATALLVGGLFFFDEINRVPERALSPLASVLDNRNTIYSAMTGLHISAPTIEARKRFRFCCALNPQLSDAGRGVLPEYIEERTLPAIPIDYLTLEELSEILSENLSISPVVLSDFENWYKRDAERRLSVRQALSIMRYATNLQATRANLPMDEALREIEPMVLRPSERSANDGTATDDSVDDETLKDDDSLEDRDDQP